MSYMSIRTRTNENELQRIRNELEERAKRNDDAHHEWLRAKEQEKLDEKRRTEAARQKQAEEKRQKEALKMEHAAESLREWRERKAVERQQLQLNARLNSARSTSTMSSISVGSNPYLMYKVKSGRTAMISRTTLSAKSDDVVAQGQNQ